MRTFDEHLYPPSNNHGSGRSGLLEHYFPLPTGDCPLPCLFQGVYVYNLYRKSASQSDDLICIVSKSSGLVFFPMERVGRGDEGTSIAEHRDMFYYRVYSIHPRHSMYDIFAENQARGGFRGQCKASPSYFGVSGHFRFDDSTMLVALHPLTLVIRTRSL